MTLGNVLTTLDNVLYKIVYEFGQCALQNHIRLWALCFTKSHTTLGNMLYKIAYDFGNVLWATCFSKSHTTLGNVLYKIRYDFRQHALQNCIRLWERALQNSIRICKSWFAKLHTTLGEITQDFGQDWTRSGRTSLT